MLQCVETSGFTVPCREFLGFGFCEGSTAFRARAFGGYGKGFGLEILCLGVGVWGTAAASALLLRLTAVAVVLNMWTWQFQQCLKSAYGVLPTMTNAGICPSAMGL